MRRALSAQVGGRLRSRVPRRLGAPLLTLALSLLPLTARAAPAAPADADDAIRRAVPALVAELVPLYQDLHRHPELSQQEVRTAGILAARLRALGFAVTPEIGGHGVVGVLKNGAGPTLLLRTDLDGLPVAEDTGLPYASPTPVMHACGHDLHMTAWLGAATLLQQLRARWRGTLVMVGQPAEERGEGARALLAAGLYTRFPRPDVALALHDSPDLAAGKLGYTPGFAMANVDSVDVVLYGRGGHGAYPHTTVDPVVMAARVVLGLQTVISRENNPLDPGVITVGAIHGGVKHNVIPDEVRLQISVRSYKDTVRARLLDGLRRQVKAEAEAAGASRPPTITVSEGTPALYNDPALTARAAAVFRRVLGAQSVVEMPPVMGAEDFSEYGRAGVPSLLFWVGATSAAAEAQARREGRSPPSLHSSRFAPEMPTALATALLGLVPASLELLGKP